MQLRFKKEGGSWDPDIYSSSIGHAITSLPLRVKLLSSLPPQLWNEAILREIGENHILLLDISKGKCLLQGIHSNILNLLHMVLVWIMIY